MLTLTLIMHIFIGTTLAGIGVVVALVMGLDTMQPILIAALIGYVISIPASWFVARAITQ